jgi:hypothetical protein
VRRARILTRQLFYHQNRLEELPGIYDYCQSGRCLAPEADRPNGCPDCPVSRSWERLERNFTTIIRRDILRDLTEEGIGGKAAEEAQDARASAGIQFRDLVTSISVALEMESQAPGEDSVNPDWTIRTAELVKIIRQERLAVRREERRKAAERREAERERLNMITGGGWRGEGE